MFSKITVLIFAGVLFVSSAAALASDNEKLTSSSKITSVVSSVANTSVKVQTEAFRSASIILNTSNGKDTTTPVNGWLLIMALFGFVLLSNRTGV